MDSQQKERGEAFMIGPKSYFIYMDGIWMDTVYTEAEAEDTVSRLKDDCPESSVYYTVEFEYADR